MSLPTPAQIALALAITKTRPIETSFDEYFQQLRKSIVEKTRLIPSDEQHYLDGALFWKRAYERSEIEKIELDNEMFHLKQQLEKTQAALEEIQCRSPVMKRQAEVAGSKQNIKANTQSKRRKVEASDSEKTDETHSFQVEGFPRDGQLLSRCLFKLQQPNFFKDTVQAQQTVRLCCHSAANVIKAVWRPHTSSKTPPDIQYDARNTFAIVDHAWKSILSVIPEISAGISQSAAGICIPDTVFLLQAFLGLLHQIALDEADDMVKSTNRGTKPHHTTKCSGSGTITRKSGSKLICRFLMDNMRNMFKDLNGDLKAHQEIFQGLMCALLDHIGSCLSLLVFVNPKSKKDPELGLLAPQGLVDVSHIDSETAMLTASISGRYLIPVLRQAIEISSSMSSTCSLSGLDQSQGDEALGTNALAESIRTQLQETLLRGVYGDVDHNFGLAIERALQATPLSENDFSSLASPQEEDSDWFIYQLWEHLGWDVLVDKLTVANEKKI